MYPHIKTSDSLTIIVNDLPHPITSTHQNFDRVLELVRNELPSSDNDELLLELIKPIKQFTRIIGDIDSNFQLEHDVLVCYIDGEQFNLPESLYKEVLEVYNESGNLQPLYNFIVKLANNPRKEVIDELWGFISACGLAITESGDFLAYKRVRLDFTDIYTGKMNNSPGTTVTEPRWKVECDSNRTCAPGLHFAAWGYLTHYASADRNKTVILSISPEHVVSIPTDYNNMKGRACEYKVLREIKSDEELKGTTVYFDDNESTDWIDWDYTNDYPDLDDLTEVEVELDSGDTLTGDTEDFEWGFNCYNSIIKYRIVNLY